GNMTQGLCLFDAEKKLVIANSRFQEMYALPAELVVRGTPLSLMREYYAEHGVIRDLVVDEQAAAIPGLQQQTFVTGDGREILIKRSPTADGGWGGSHGAVTETRRTGR